MDTIRFVRPVVRRIARKAAITVVKPSLSETSHVKADAGTVHDVQEKASPVPHSEDGWNADRQMIYHEFLIATSREGAWYG